MTYIMQWTKRKPSVYLSYKDKRGFFWNYEFKQFQLKILMLCWSIVWHFCIVSWYGHMGKCDFALLWTLINTERTITNSNSLYTTLNSADTQSQRNTLSNDRCVQLHLHVCMTTACLRELEMCKVESAAVEF